MKRRIRMDREKRLVHFRSRKTDKDNGGSGCGSVGKSVDTDTSGPLFDCRQWLIFILNVCSLSTVSKRRK